MLHLHVILPMPYEGESRDSYVLQIQKQMLHTNFIVCC